MHVSHFSRGSTDGTIFLRLRVSGSRHRRLNPDHFDAPGPSSRGVSRARGRPQPNTREHTMTAPTTPSEQADTGTDIDALRERINAADEELIRIWRERAELSRQV